VLPLIVRHSGRIIETASGSTMAEFLSVSGQPSDHVIMGELNSSGLFDCKWLRARAIGLDQIDAELEHI